MLVLIKFGILRTIQASTQTDCGTTLWNIFDTLSDVECLCRGPHHITCIAHTQSGTEIARLFTTLQTHNHTQHKYRVRGFHPLLYYSTSSTLPTIIYTKHELITLSNKTKSRVQQTLDLLNTTNTETVQIVCVDGDVIPSRVTKDHS